MLSVALGLSLTGLGACNYDRKSTVDGMPADATVGWTVVDSYVLGQCKDCHSGQQSPDFSGLTNVRGEIANIWTQVSRDSMPPRKGKYVVLSDCLKGILKEWIALGLPEKSNKRVSDLPECAANQRAIPIEKMPLNYQTLKSRILDPMCSNCHCSDASCAAKLILFIPYSTLTCDPQTFCRWSAPAAKSQVIRSLTRTDKFRMPPPTTADPLSPAEIDFVSRWIDAGKPEW